MTSYVFISDLHLSKEDENLNKQFDKFIQDIAPDYQYVYILGDFFNTWVGDDNLDKWSRSVALKLASLAKKGIKIKLMHGNRDFLLGDDFCKLANCELISDPYLLKIEQMNILLSHGDDLCTLDKQHQRFRKLTRSNWFKKLFLKTPLRLRLWLANKVRRNSQKTQKAPKVVDVVRDSVTRRMLSYGVKTMIHGHTHKPQIQYYTDNNTLLLRIVLSDWDDNTRYLCYDLTNGFYMRQCP